MAPFERFKVSKYVASMGRARGDVHSDQVIASPNSLYATGLTGLAGLTNNM